MLNVLLPLQWLSKITDIDNSKSWKLVSRGFPFMGMFDWGGVLISAAQWTRTNAPTDAMMFRRNRGPIPSFELHNSSINIFQTPTLYTRVSSSHYQSMTIICENWTFCIWILQILWEINRGKQLKLLCILIVLSLPISHKFNQNPLRAKV